MSKKILFSTVALTIVLAVGFSIIKSINAASVEPVYVEGNPTCESLGYPYGVKFDYPEGSTGGTYTLGNGTVTWSTDGTYVDWSSTIGVDAVIVKGGPNANVYYYNPESKEDEDLVSPTNPNNDKPYGLSHVDFCFDYELEVSKTAEPYYTRTWEWEIDKEGDKGSLILSIGQTHTVSYTVKVDASYVDSGWGVKGEITIKNPDPKYSAIITGVSDEITGGVSPTLNCGEVNFPYTLVAGDTLTCTYNASLTSSASGTNTATVITDTESKVGGGTATKDFVFGDPTTEIDECVDVTDDIYGDLGKVCAEDSQKTFEYNLTVGPYSECGSYEFVNTASFVTNDTSKTGSDSWTVDVDVPCGGCTLTQGYWKTHSKYGPAPYDDTWTSVITYGEDTAFFSSGKSWYQVLWTAPKKGDAYFILAHQYIAARLNILNGASPTSEVNSALAFAGENGTNGFFNTYDPAKNLSKSVRSQAIYYAGVLGSFNEGIIGPGHCSE